MRQPHFGYIFRVRVSRGTRRITKATAFYCIFILLLKYPHRCFPLNYLQFYFAIFYIFYIESKTRLPLGPHSSRE